MTSLKRRWSVKVQRMLRAGQQPFEAIATATGRIFSPRNDDYPATGAQPLID
jgi:cobalamin biosynthesis Mg chelatase CobN